MEQVYFVRKPSGSATLECVYQYGSYVYAGPVRVAPPVSDVDLPEALAEIQRVQSEIPFLAETAAVTTSSEAGQTLAALHEAMEFIGKELDGIDETIAPLLASEPWLDADDARLYFEFEVKSTFTFRVCGGHLYLMMRRFARGFTDWMRLWQEAVVVFAKFYKADVMLTVVFFAVRQSTQYPPRKPPFDIKRSSCVCACIHVQTGPFPRVPVRSLGRASAGRHHVPAHPRSPQGPTPSHL